MTASATLQTLGRRTPFKLWSALCHQGGVYSACFAAVPRIIHTLPPQAHRFFVRSAARPIISPSSRSSVTVSRGSLVRLVA